MAVTSQRSHEQQHHWRMRMVCASARAEIALPAARRNSRGSNSHPAARGRLHTTQADSSLARCTIGRFRSRVRWSSGGQGRAA
eukprot:362492-Chlamydomonas_euryale.AAC.3